MRLLLKITIFIVLCSLYNANATNNLPINITKEKTITSKVGWTMVLKNNPIYQQHQTFYVTAKSGLNYRDSPKGKLLGKFSFNTKVTVIEHSGIKDQITDEGKIVKGEWVGIQHKSDTVYVFNAFLSAYPVYDYDNIYKLTPYYVDNDNEVSTAFINISETYFENKKFDYLISEDDRKDTVTLSSKERKTFLKTVHISEDDTVFIYDLKADKVHSYKVKDLPVISCLNIYSYGGEYKEDDFEFGFDLEKLNIDYDDNFVSIGKHNPFQTGNLKRMIWKEIGNQNFPKRFDVQIIDKDIRSWFDGITTGKSYFFSHQNFDYYIQDLQKEGNTIHRYLVVTHKNSNEVFYEDVYIESEGSYLSPLDIENSEHNDYYIQWTGKMFKQKPSVILGFIGYSFGCESIDFVDKEESYIRILCDNRH